MLFAEFRSANENQGNPKEKWPQMYSLIVIKVGSMINFNKLLLKNLRIKNINPKKIEQ
tara:strand:- start:626 stop:799 length:174 start_codon:yes stop_codon:yes gene_type:complete